MRSILGSLLLVGLLLSLAGSSALGNAPERRVVGATQVLQDMQRAAANGIPTSMIENAEALVIIPEVLKVGFIVGVQRGEGVVLARQADRTWGLPQFVTITAGSVGWQIGAESSDFILVFRTRRGVDNLMRGKFTIGADANATVGPVGRQIGAATDARLQSEIFTYSRSRGLFAGVSLAGSSLDINRQAATAFYGSPPGTPAARVPESAVQLVALVTQISDRQEATVPPLAPPAANDPVESLRETLLANARALGPVLDEQWRQFLALPDELSTPGRTPDLAVMRKVMERFDTVANDAKFRALNQRPEFVTMRNTVVNYYNALAAQQSQEVALPPPPGQ